MTGTRATITVGVDGANDSRRSIETVADAMRRMNAESLSRISGQIGAFNDRINGLQSTMGNIASYTVAGVSLGMLTGKIGDALDQFGDLDDMAQRTGSSIESLSKLQKIAAAFGADFGTVGTALANLNKGLSGTDDESNKTRKALAFLGVSARDSAGKLREPGDLMIEVANRLQNYQDGAGKAALANDLFGKSGRELLPYMGDVSESIDNFSSTTKESVMQATALQDKMGMLRVRSNELFTDLVVAGLPAMTDLADGIQDVIGAQDKLVVGEASEWADALAVGAARVVDVMALIPRVISAAYGSLKVVGADIGFLASAATDLAELRNPINALLKLRESKDPFAGTKAALAERNKILEEANAKYDRLWNQPANLFEQAVMKRLSNRKGDAKAPEEEDNKKPADYNSGKDVDAAAAEKAAEAYRALTESIKAKIKQSVIEANTGKAATAAQQEQIRLDELIAVGKLKLSPAQRAVVDGLLQELEANNSLIESNKRASEVRQKWLDANEKALSDAIKEADQNEALAATFGMTKSAIERVELARLKDRLAQSSSLKLIPEEIAHLEKLIAAKERSAAALTSVDAAEAAQKAGEELDKFLDPTKAQTFGEALKGAFGTAGDSLTQLISNLDAYSIRQAEVDKARKDAAMRFATDSKGYAMASAAISEKELRSRVTAYGDMTSAAKGFFSEGSKGYHTLETAEKAFRAYELAMATETLMKKLFFKEAEVAAHTTLNATKLAGEATATAASTGLAATEASAWGITAVTKAIASLPFPLNLAAGAATMAAVVAVGAKMAGSVGGSGISLSQARQEAQGTGSVFGDSGAKSESIARAMERVEDNTYQGLVVSMGMLTALNDIKSNIGSFAALVVRDKKIMGDTAAFAGLDGKSSGFFSRLGNSIFGGKKTLEDSGFTVDRATLGSIAHGGLNAMTYADIKKDGGWFSSDKISTHLEGLGAEGNRQITKVLLSLTDSVQEAGIALGLPTDALTQKLDAFVVDIGKISFKGMKSDEVEKTLQAVFSKLGDDMSQFAIGGLEQFQQVGEGYMETLVRIAQGYQSVDVVMKSMGMTFGAIGVDSIAARQRLLDLSGGVEKFVQNSERFLADFFTEQEQAAALRARVQPILDQYGLKSSGEDATRKFRDYLVALDPATEAGAKAYATLSQIAPALKQIADAEQYIYDERKDLQAQIDELTMTSAQLLTKQRDALDESNRALFDQVEAAKRATAVFDERKGLQDELDQLTMSSAQLLERQRQALDESNRALFDQIQGVKQAAEAQRAAAQASKDRGADILSGLDSAFSALQSVVGREKAALQELTGKHQALSSALRGSLDSMSVAGQERDDRLGAQAQIRTALAIAKASGVLPDADSLKGALSILSQDSSSMFATQQGYLRDFYATQNDIGELAGLTDKTLSVEEQSLKALDGILTNAQQQVDALKGIDMSIFSVAEALRGFDLALGAAKGDAVASSGGEIAKLYKELLGRPADAGGLSFYKDKMSEGVTLDQIRADMLGSAEYKKLKGIPGFANGGDHAGGLRWVGEFQPELEATGPSRIHTARSLMDALRSPTDNNAALASAVARLTAVTEDQARTIRRLEETAGQTQKHVKRVADGLQIVTNGFSAMRTKQEAPE